jgi:chromosome segregation ATPase
MAKNDKPKFSDDQLRKLFQEYDKLAEARATIDVEAEQAARRLSGCVQRIHELTGLKNFLRKDGSRLVMMIRPGEKEAERLKAENKPVPEKTYFFRGEGGESYTAGV